jgi:UDP-galactopyranose mutase
MLINELKHIAIDVDYLPDNIDTNAHWIYEPNEKFSYHRMLLRHNFCTKSRGYWTETNSKRSGPAKGFRYRNDYAYPVNTKTKPETIRAILEWAKSYNIIGAGRWGTWEHMNSDVAVSEGIKLGKSLLK